MAPEALSEMQPLKVAKATRTWIRLKHPLEADTEINTFLPDSLTELEEALARGGVDELRAWLAAWDNVI